MTRPAPSPSYLAFAQIDDAVRFGDEVSVWCRLAMKELTMEATPAEQLASTAFITTHEHHLSLLILVKDNLMGSAAALIRPLFETFARGLWLCLVKDGRLLRRFEQGLDSSDPEVLIRKCIQLSGAERHRDLLRSWLESRKSLHCFVHSGYQALIRRSGKVSFPNDELIAMVCFSTAMSLHATVELTVLANRRLPVNGHSSMPAKLAVLKEGLTRRLARMGFADPFDSNA